MTGRWGTIQTTAFGYQSHRVAITIGGVWFEGGGMSKAAAFREAKRRAGVRCYKHAVDHWALMSSTPRARQTPYDRYMALNGHRDK